MINIQVFSGATFHRDFAPFVKQSVLADIPLVCKLGDFVAL